MVDPGFDVEETDVVVAIAVRLEETELVEAINKILAGISEEVRNKLMEDAVGRAE